jgi:hypothetical protein
MRSRKMKRAAELEARRQQLMAASPGGKVRLAFVTTDHCCR